MKLRRLRSMRDFPLEGRSEHFRSAWQMELTPGEETSPHRHYQSEELLYVMSGIAVVTIEDAEREVSMGEVVLVPPRHSHKIYNPSRRIMRAVSVESRFDLEEPATAPLPEEPRGALEHALRELPAVVDEGTAIAKIVELFGLGSEVSESVETHMDNEEEGQRVLADVEKRIMKALVELSRRYRKGRQ